MKRRHLTKEDGLYTQEVTIRVFCTGHGAQGHWIGHCIHGVDAFGLRSNFLYFVLLYEDSSVDTGPKST